MKSRTRGSDRSGPFIGLLRFLVRLGRALGPGGESRRMRRWALMRREYRRS
jgi:hypothetical protein